MTIGYRIRVEQPCREDWNAMAPSGAGRHCAACDRTLIDVSNFNDSELLIFLQKHPHACARFARHQVNKVLLFNLPPNRHHTLPKWLAGALLLAASQTAAAQQDQLLTEVPKCDDSAAAVELRVEGFVPLPGNPIDSVADTTENIDTAMATDRSHRTHSRKLQTCVAPSVDIIKMSITFDSGLIMGYFRVDKDIKESAPIVMEWEKPIASPALDRLIPTYSAYRHWNAGQQGSTPDEKRRKVPRQFSFALTPVHRKDEDDEGVTDELDEWLGSN